MTEQPDRDPGHPLPEQSEQPEQSQGEPQPDAAAPTCGDPSGDSSGDSSGETPGGAAEDHEPARQGSWLDEESQQPAESAESDALDDDLALARLALGELTADLQRLQAEYLNYKRRVDRDRELVRQNATFMVLSELLPVLDSIDRAREHGDLDPGFRAVAEALETVVAKLGLTKFGEKGEEFDPNQHEAIMHGHSPDVTTTTIDVVAQAGYRIGERVVRPAKVTVLDPEG